MIYERYALAVRNLEKQMDPNGVIIPLGFDGAVVYHLLNYRSKIRRSNVDDFLQNTIGVKSKTKDVDDKKLHKILSPLRRYNMPVYAIDLRAKSGSLGRLLRTVISNYNIKWRANINLKYCVLFDTNFLADERGTTLDLRDDQRLRWVDGVHEIEKRIRQTNDSWKYYIDHADISRFDHVPKIKELLI